MILRRLIENGQTLRQVAMEVSQEARGRGADGFVITCKHCGMPMTEHPEPEGKKWDCRERKDTRPPMWY